MKGLNSNFNNVFHVDFPMFYQTVYVMRVAEKKMTTYKRLQLTLNTYALYKQFELNQKKSQIFQSLNTMRCPDSLTKVCFLLLLLWKSSLICIALRKQGHLKTGGF